MVDRLVNNCFQCNVCSLISLDEQTFHRRRSIGQCTTVLVNGGFPVVFMQRLQMLSSSCSSADAAHMTSSTTSIVPSPIHVRLNKDDQSELVLDIPPVTSDLVNELMTKVGTEMKWLCMNCVCILHDDIPSTILHFVRKHRTCVYEVDRAYVTFANSRYTHRP